ncbi:MAG: hypothetical protein PHW04_07185 [Candidatus Wallbacteria bacterium]|nr:hypothetical protein [Candidatus Wallbacteria bacterium]
MKTKENLKEIIEKSGNSFHFQVMKFLREKEWKVLVSPYYLDCYSEKPREVDIIAEKSFKMLNRYKEVKGIVNLRLIIECKYIDKNLVFWTDVKDHVNAIKLVEHVAGIKAPDRNTYYSKHHYLSDCSVGKLFSGEKPDGSEREPFFTAITQCINSLIFFRSIQRQGKAIFEKEKEHYPILHTLQYPLIVCKNFNSMFQFAPSEDNEPEKIERFFQFEVNYAFKDNECFSKEYFIIDVVDFTHFEEFLDDIEEKDIENALRTKYMG